MAGSMLKCSVEFFANVNETMFVHWVRLVKWGKVDVISEFDRRRFEASKCTQWDLTCDGWSRTDH